MASAGVFLLAVAICLINLWTEPAQSGQLYVLGVTARANGHDSIGVRPAALIWCIAVPLGIAAAMSYRHGRREHLVRDV